MPSANDRPPSDVDSVAGSTASSRSTSSSHSLIRRSQSCGFGEGTGTLLTNGGGGEGGGEGNGEGEGCGRGKGGERCGDLGEQSIVSAGSSVAVSSLALFDVLRFKNDFLEVS